LGLPPAAFYFSVIKFIKAYNSRSMTGLKHLREKTIIYRLIGVPALYRRTVKTSEEQGLWIDAGTLIDDLHRDQAWKQLVDNVGTSPAMFVPFSSFVFLIVATEE
jgi:hypothetical protein